MTIALYNEKYISDKEGNVISVILDIKEYEKIRTELEELNLQPNSEPNQSVNLELSEQLIETKLIEPKFKDLTKLINLAGIVE